MLNSIFQKTLLETYLMHYLSTDFEPATNLISVFLMDCALKIYLYFTMKPLKDQKLQSQ